MLTKFPSVSLNLFLLQMNSGVGATVDPFDYVFGFPAAREEVHLPDTSSVSPKTQTRNRRRSHRKRRTHHQEDLSNLQHV